jgi:hypothetical protein
MLQQVQPWFVDALLAIININISHLRATVARREEPLQVGRGQLRSLVEVQLQSDHRRSFGARVRSIQRAIESAGGGGGGAAAPEEGDATVEAVAGLEHYRYLLIYLKDVFATLVCTQFMYAGNGLQLAINLLGEVDAFLLHSERQIDKHWKQLNQRASRWVADYFPSHYRWRAMFKGLFPYIQPYLALNAEHNSGLSILTLDGPKALLNIPDAVVHDVVPRLVGFARGGMFKPVGRLDDLWQCLADNFVPPTSLPLNSQVGNSCQLQTRSPIPRNTRLQLLGEITAEGAFHKRLMSYQVASPVLPTKWLQALGRIFFNSRPRNARQLRDFCQAYCETIRSMCDRAFSSFFPAPARGWEYVYVHLISNLFPPEPDAIEAMSAMVVDRVNYANAPFKDFQGYGVSRIDFRLSPDVQRVLRRLAGVSDAMPLLSAFDRAMLRLNERKLVDADVLLIVKSAAAADEVSPIKSMMAWFFVLLLEHHYSTCRREDKAPYWQVSFKRAVRQLTPEAAQAFKLRWNVFVHMEPQLSAVTTLYALMIDHAERYLGFEGCKSAKDRATELLLYKPFVTGVLFDHTSLEIEINLRHQLVHNLVFLMLYAHVPGTMNNGGYADTSHLEPGRYPGGRARLELLNRYLRMLRHGGAKWRASIFADQKPASRAAVPGSVPRQAARRPQLRRL